MHVVNQIHCMLSESWGGGDASLIYQTDSGHLGGSVKHIFTAYHRKHCSVTFNLIHTMVEK
jgi:hypothetical protein